MSPLQRYRSAQRRARALFEPFTREHCPTCATPCCVQPTRVRPVDVVLAEELGYPLPVVDVTGPVLDALRGGAAGEPAGAPCEFLRAGGCSFPADLRPFGCAAFVCEPMRRLLPPAQLARVEAAVADLEEAHARLMAALNAAD